MSRSIKVTVVDDQALLREGVKTLLSSFNDIRIVAEAGSIRETVVKLGATPCDVAVVNMELGPGRGLECLRRIHELRGKVRMVALSRNVAREGVVAAIRAGADGYVVTSASSSDLHAAIQEVAANRMFLHPLVAGAVVDELRSASSQAPASEVSLTEREREILGQVCRGNTNRGIGEALFLTENTVKTHLKALYRKIRVSDRGQAVLWATSAGLVTETL